MHRGLRSPNRLVVGLLLALGWAWSFAQAPMLLHGDAREFQNDGVVTAQAVAPGVDTLRAQDENSSRRAPSLTSFWASERRALTVGLQVSARRLVPAEARHGRPWHRTAPHDATAPPLAA